MQNLLQSVQMANGIYNSDIEPEHEFDGYCNCAIHQYKWKKMNRLGVQKMWSNAVMYPGEKAYHDCYQATLFTNNPYRYRVVSPYGNFVFSSFYVQKPSPSYYASSVHQTIALNATLNAEAQAAIDAKEPRINIWNIEQLESSMSNMTLATDSSSQADDEKQPVEKGGAEKSSAEKRQSIAGSLMNSKAEGSKPSRFATLKKAVGVKSPEEKAVAKTQKMSARGRELRNAVLEEEQGRWPTQEWRQIVANYQEKVGMTRKIAHLRAHQPTQYLHLLRAGYFEPIPVAWANLASNPLKFALKPHLDGEESPLLGEDMKTRPRNACIGS